MVLRKMKIKSANLKDTQLDWAVAKCEGYNCVVLNDGYSVGINRDRVIDYFNPSINWGWSGPIIEREHIDVSSSYSAHFPNQPWQYRAEKRHFGKHHKAGRNMEVGDTLLEAAMRCYVASKLGDEVEIPMELI